MEARFGDGLAVDADLARAAEEAARQAVAPLGGQRPDLVAVFVCGDNPDEVAVAGERAAAVSGGRSVVGCSASGVIGACRGVEQTRAVSVWAAVLPGARVRTFHLEVMRADEGLAVVGLPERADDDGAAVLFADPYSFPADGFVERSNTALAGLPIVGGMGTGYTGAGSTRLFIDGRTVTRGAVGALLGGVETRPLVSQGCRPVGPAMTVTAAEGNLLLELAGAPALLKLEDVVASLSPEDQALASAGLHLGLAFDEYVEEHDYGDFIVRGIVGADEKRRGLVIGDLVEVGRTVRFQVRDADSADRDLALRLGRFRAEQPQVRGALLFSCNGRGRNLFPTSDHDVIAVRRELAAAGVGGFFAAGEFGPVGGRNYVHGYSAALLAFPDVGNGDAG